MSSLNVAVGCMLVAGSRSRSSVGCLCMSQRVGCLSFGRDGGVGDGDLGRSDGISAYLRMCFNDVEGFVMRYVNGAPPNGALLLHHPKYLEPVSSQPNSGLTVQ
eukprot:scaffold206466_cov52-Attheya_sp.AAC.1